MVPFRLALALALASTLAGCELFLGDLSDDEPDAASPTIDAGVIDASARLCATDPGYQDLGIAGSTYLVQGESTQANARTGCAADGARLVSIGSAREFNAVRDLVTTSVPASCGTACAWVGLRQAGGVTAVGQGWSWPDGTDGLQNWFAGQPDDFDTVEDGQENCSVIEADGLHDESCSLVRFSVCEC